MEIKRRVKKWQSEKRIEKNHQQKKPGEKARAFTGLRAAGASAAEKKEKNIRDPNEGDK